MDQSIWVSHLVGMVRMVKVASLTVYNGWAFLWTDIYMGVRFSVSCGEKGQHCLIQAHMNITWLILQTCQILEMYANCLTCLPGQSVSGCRSYG